MVRLYIEDPQGSVKNPEYDLDEITIGRAKDNTIILPDRNISRHHIRLFWDGKGWMVEDAGSSYGVVYREEPLSQPEKLIPNAYIQIGNYRLKLISDTRLQQAAEKEVSGMFTPEQEDTQRKKTAQFAAPQPAPDAEELDDDFDEWPDEPMTSGSDSRKGLILGIVISLVVLGVIAFFLFKPEQTTPPKKEPQKNLLALNKKVKKRAVKKAVPQVKPPVENAGQGKVEDVAQKMPADSGQRKAVDEVQRKPADTGQVKAKPAEKKEPAKKQVIAQQKKKANPEQGKTTEPNPVKKQVQQKPVHKKIIQNKRVALKKRTIKKTVRRKKTVVPKKKKVEKPEQSGATAMLQEARKLRGVAKLNKLKQCLAQYGNACCKANKFIASYYLGTGALNKSIPYLKKYKACTKDPGEKSWAQQRIIQCQ